MKNLENRVATVTDGGSGVGRAISLLCASEGAKIIVSNGAAAMKLLAGLLPMGRLGTSEEIAEMSLWLNSDKASFVACSY